MKERGLENMNLFDDNQLNITARVEFSQEVEGGRKEILRSPRKGSVNVESICTKTKTLFITKIL